MDEARRNLEESVFGMSGNINATAAATVFVGLIGFLVLLELAFNRAEEMAAEVNGKELFEKLKKELTMMGILSFTVFIYQTAYADAENAYYEAFEMSHIIILFVAIAFIIQASFLLNFAVEEGNNFLRTSRTTHAELLEQYESMKEQSPWQTWFFHSAPFWVPTIPAFRNDIANKLIERLFLKQHKLPDDFRFAQYIKLLFQKYISELGEVSWISWFLLGALVLFNLAKIAALDQLEVYKLCKKEPGEEEEEERRMLSGLSGRMLEEEEEMHAVCYQYIFQYAFVVIEMLFVFIFIVYAISCYYFENLIYECCRREGVKVQGNRTSFVTVLSKIAKEEEEADAALQNVGLDGLQSGRPAARLNSVDKRLGGNKRTKSKEIHAVTAHNPLQGLKKPLLQSKAEEKDVEKGTHFNVSKKNGDGEERSDILESRMNEQLEELEELKEEHDLQNKRKKMSYCEKLYSYCEEYYEEETSNEGRLKKIFIFQSSKLYFLMVELTLLLQCFYIAMWATQLLPLVSEAEQYQVLWAFAFTIPGLFNFVIIRLILKRAVMLQAICGVHAEVLGEVKEEAIEEEHCLDKLRLAVREAFLSEAENQQDGRLSPEIITKIKTSLKNMFDQYDDDGSGAISESEFLNILTDLKIYLSRRAFRVMWLAVDYDMSGELSWDEMFIILFPELKAQLKDELAIVATLREAISTNLRRRGLTDKAAAVDFMQQEFEKFDEDSSGQIDEQEMLVLVEEYLPHLDQRAARQLFAAVDIDGEGGIDWSEFRDLVFGAVELTNRMTVKGWV